MFVDMTLANDCLGALAKVEHKQVCFQCTLADQALAEWPFTDSLCRILSNLGSNQQVPHFGLAVSSFVLLIVPSARVLTL